MNKYNNAIPLFIIVSVYIVLTLLNINHPYFWDNIQQTSKEANWIYSLDFNSLGTSIRNSAAEFTGTGYHPPLMGIMTALLWKIIGYKLWVSHLFICFWFVILIYNLSKVIKLVIPEKFVGWVVLIVLLESALLTQFSISSPDFILFTAFVIAIRGVLERKNFLLMIGIFFLCGINMRGIFAGAILFFANVYYSYLNSNKKLSLKVIGKILLPYLPTLVILSAYYIFYFYNIGWFFSESSAYGSHYSMPESFTRIIIHLAEFGLRTLENGRFIIWLIGFFVAFKIFKSKEKLSPEFKFFILIFLLLNGLYLIFVFITQMPFSARYFIPQFFILTLLSSWGIIFYLKSTKVKIAFIFILLFELTGHLWIYPEKIAKAWDCTLSHSSFYELRKDCFDYIDNNNLNYNEISGGFCLYGDRKFIELSNESKIVGTEPDRKFFIYSNISNLDDNFVTELKNPNRWVPVKRFDKGFVNIVIYRNILIE